MSIRQYGGFTPIVSTAPGFQVTFDNTSTNAAIQSTDSPVRLFRGGGGRTIRITSNGNNDFHIAFGPSTIVAEASEGIRILGGTAELISPPRPSDTHIGFHSSTDVTAQITVGYGGQ